MKENLTLADYSEKILKPLANEMAREIAIEILKTPIGLPATRKQKFKWWIEDKKQRCKDIWTILTGGDIHENCGPY